MLCKHDLDDESWYVVHHTPGVTGFVGNGTKPIPLQDEEVDKILQQMGLVEQKTKIIDIEIGESIRVKNGPLRTLKVWLKNFCLIGGAKYV